ncbi:hypothetical protein [Schaalia turicensis]|uniref:hypothetical protein n=1 Tax=Schaalia turicensis TaxID=131111 RepID=UPI0036AFE7BF
MSTTTAQAPPRMHAQLFNGRTFITAFLLFLMYTMGMSLLTPLQGSPDEPAHEIYGYEVVTGNLPITSKTVMAPAYLRAGAPDCWRFEILETVFCSPAVTADNTLIETTTSADNYPPLYYFLTHQPLKYLSGKSALWAMRLCSAVLFSALAATGVSSLVAGLRHRYAPFWALGLLTPACFMFAGVSNPQAMEISAALAMGGFLIPLLTHPSAREARWRWILGGCAALLVILSRPVGPYWAIGICLLLAGIVGWRDILQHLKNIGFWIFLAICAGGSGIWMWWSRIGDTYGPEPTILINDGWAALTGRMGLFIPYYMRETIGTAGWRSVTSSIPIAVLYWVVIFAVIGGAFWYGRLHQRITIALALLYLPFSAVLMNTLVLDFTTYPIWQGRYALPFLFPFLWVCVTLLVVKGGLPTHIQRWGGRGITALFALATVDLTVRMAWRFYTGMATQPITDIFTSTPPRALLGMGLACVAAIIGCALVWVASAPRKFVSPAVPSNISE